MSLSASRWICLLTLAVVMLFSASAVDTFRRQTCCYKVAFKMKGKIHQCFEQKPGSGCPIHAYLVKNVQGEKQCINSTAQWLKKKIEAGEISCRRLISKRRFEVVDDDVEA